MQKHDQLDAIDLEHIEQALRTHGCWILWTRIRVMEEQAHEELTTCTRDSFERVQERLQTLRRVLDLPVIIRREVLQRERRGEGKHGPGPAKRD